MDQDHEPEPASPPAPKHRFTPEVLTQPRVRRPTWKILQQLPEPPAPCPVPEPLPPIIETTPEPDETPFIWQGIRSALNSFGLFREYPSPPTYNPDEYISLADVSYAPPETTTAAPLSPTSYPFSPTSDSDHPDPDLPSFAPFPNRSIFGLMKWAWTGSNLKSLMEMTKLVNFLKSDGFHKEELEGFDLARDTAKFDKTLESDSQNPDAPRDGWKEDEVDIQIPDGKEHKDMDDVPIFSVPGFHHRSLIEVIRTAIQDTGDRCFHYTPFKQFWKPSPDSPTERIYDEIYSSDAMLAEHIKVQRLPAEPGCTLERVVVALMFWSDSTHLANFGTASLWPLYLFLGNQSKWLRSKPRAGACHHVAYIPKVCSIANMSDIL